MAPVLAALASAMLTSGPLRRTSHVSAMPSMSSSLVAMATSAASGGVLNSSALLTATMALFLVGSKPRNRRPPARARSRARASAWAKQQAASVAAVGVTTKDVNTQPNSSSSEEDSVAENGTDRNLVTLSTMELGANTESVIQTDVYRQSSSYGGVISVSNKRPPRYSAVKPGNGAMSEQSSDSDYQEYEEEDLVEASDLRSGGQRDIVIVTTATVPWMTGTAVNPLLRAMYLAKDGHSVTLVVPWLSEKSEQESIFSNGVTFDTKDEQTKAIREWSCTEVADVQFAVKYYDGVYSEELGSILPVGEITAVIDQMPDISRDICVLEEPEHLTWHHAGAAWTKLFRVVVGVVHTNYLEYVRDSGFFGPQRALFLSFLNSWVCRSYCHRVIKLSDALQDFPHSVTCNIHGVRDKFIQIGRECGSRPFPRGAYFMGKVLWAKGYRDLIDLMEEHFERSGRVDVLPIDFFGTGPDSAALKETINNSPALKHVRFHDKVADPTGDYLQGYKVYVNASQSDVVCTATAEALAMGKTVVLLDHPSNDFFMAFPNCLTFRSCDEFSALLRHALQHDPVPLRPEDAYHLTWSAATERFYDAVRIPPSLARPSKVDHVLATTHKTLSKFYPQPGLNLRRARSRDSLTKEDTARSGTLCPTATT